MEEFWRSKKSGLLAALTISWIFVVNFNLCCSLNDEGVALLRFKEKVTSDPHRALWNWSDKIGVETPCSWFGIHCSDGYVVALNLKDLCLRGTLAPDIGNLVHMKSIILRNNSFSGVVPKEIARLKELEVLDIGYNNFNGELPHQLGNNSSISILLLDNNELLSNSNPEIYELQKLSEARVEEDLSSSSTRASTCNELVISWNSGETEDIARRKLSQEAPFVRRSAFRFFLFPPPPDSIVIDSPPPTSSPSPAPDTAKAPSPEPLASTPSPSPVTTISPSSVPSPAEGPGPGNGHSRRNHHRVLILSVATVGPILLLLIVGVFFWQSGRVSTVKPWATGISGQLQRAFVTGVPKLKRSELEAACEDFSNVIGTSSLCTLYKGTLSSGVEIAVASIAVASPKNWSNSLEAQFRKKIDTLSKVNHKNFVSLLGYCMEDEPFTRMLVFEYAPNGTLFEHLHIKEAEHLNWATRMRIAMGMAYCLDHMHQLTPPLVHTNLNSSAVYLTEDYAAKISDFALSGEGEGSEPNIHQNIYSFGVVLFEMITGRIPSSANTDLISGTESVREMVDPTLESYDEDQLQRIGDVIRWCGDRDPRRRPTMGEVCGRLREITGIEPDGAVPKVSPLWWAELEIQSSEGS